MGALNPAYDSQGSRPLPVAFGYVAGSGDEFMAITDPSNNQYGFNGLFDGECDGIEQFAKASTAQLYSVPVPARAIVLPGAPYQFPNLVQFHAGRWTPIGLPLVPDSTGPDQGVDTYFNAFPTIVPAQSFSGICYVTAEQHNLTSTLRGTATVPPLSIYGIFRGALCRIFDGSGNVTGYQFSTNPVWHRVEMILRYKVKRQQPQVAGLTDAEKAFFDWPSIVALAARNDFILPNGAPRFRGNYVFAARATLASMLETSMRCDRSFIDDVDGKVGMFGYDAVDSSFTLTANHIFPNTFRAAQKDLTRKPNVFIPKFRDLDLAALVKVNTAANNDAGATSGTVSVPAGYWGMFFDTGGSDPFSLGNNLIYGDGSDPTLNGDYIVSENPDPTLATPLIFCVGNTGVTATSTGGYIGTNSSRFAQRAPTTVQHRQHQKASGAVAPGIPNLPKIAPVEYDLGNMSYDQANRLMQYEMASTLGNDVTGWKPPVAGTVKVKLEAIDANGNAFARLRPNQRFTVGADVDPVLFGDYLVDPEGGGITVIPPSEQEPLGAIQVAFKTYNPDAYSDTSYPPDDSLRTIASAALQYVNGGPLLGNVAWVLQGTPSTVGTTVSMADLKLHILGAEVPTAYPGASWTGLTSGASYVLCVDDPGGGATPVFTAIAGTLPLVSPPSYRYPVYAGIFT